MTGKTAVNKPESTKTGPASQATPVRGSRSRLMIFSMLTFVGFSILISIVTPTIAGTGGLLLLLINLENDFLFTTTAVVLIILYICALLFFVWLFAYTMNLKVLKPINSMTSGLRKITEGDHAVRLTEKVDYEFVEMQGAFNYMAEKLETAEKAKAKYEMERSMIFSNISHDLKTPISTIAGYAGALADNMVTDEAKKLEYLQAIRAKALHMNGLVELLFEYARLDNMAYELRREKLELTEFLRGILATMYTDFETQSIALDIVLPDESVEYEADRLELARAVSNLLSNAILHNGPGHRVSLCLRNERASHPETGIEGPYYAIYVSDDGDEIPAELRDRLFTPFIVGDESRSSRGGSGLGLAITRKIVERHGGFAGLVDGPTGFTKSFVLYLPQENSSVKPLVL